MDAHLAKVARAVHGSRLWQSRNKTLYTNPHLDYLVSMKKNLLLTLMALLLSASIYGTSYAGEIFRLAPGVQNMAMGGTGLSYAENPAAGWWNPALMSLQSQSGVQVMRANHFGGLLQQNQLSLALGGKVRSSFHLNHLSIDKIKLTTLENPSDTLSNFNRPIVFKTVTNSDFILTGSLARSLSRKFALGVSPKLAYRDLAGNSGYGVGADLGFLYDGGNFMAGANLRDFFGTWILWENGTREVAIPSLDLEGSYGFKLFKDSIPLRIALRSELFLEDRGEASTFALGALTGDLHFGVMVAPLPYVKVMGGYDADAPTAGLGLTLGSWGIDYALKTKAPEGLGSTQRISLNFTW